ncbi:MAG TPA: hypothetical protein EYN91_16340 [Candidatus Melainabacteria bacterium]|nr:hypothetical protein [Candidatus Melainabacteria bacterium]HIN66301.1 hypothetical protein [Candidatus Obscuribacterales bacterium]
MKKPLKGKFALKLLTLSSLILGFSTFLLEATVSASEPIKATIEFSRSLPALGDEYADGAQFKIQSAKVAQQTLKWRRVPKWLAGVWHTEFTSVNVLGIPIRYPTKSDFISGYQQDAKGHIWHPIINRVSRVDGETYYEYQIPQGDQLFEVDKETSTRYTRSTRVRVNKASGRIITSFQQEDIAVTRPVQEGVVEVNANCCVFNKAGQKVKEQNISVVEERIAPFHPIDSHGGINFVESLASFLKAEEKAQWIPPARELIAPSQIQSRILATEDANSKLMDGVPK